MRLILIIILVITGFISGIASMLSLQSFTAITNGTDITVRFVSQNEVGIDNYYIERAKAESNSFVMVKELDPTGNFNTYSFIDEGPFLKKSKSQEIKNSEDVYIYRIKAVYKDGSISYSDNANVTHKTSSVTKTWGMIKEMFR